MPLAIPRRTVETLSRAKGDPKEAIFAALAGKLSGVRVMFNMVLVAVYIRPEKTAGGIIRPSDNVAEDIWQGKSGLVVKLGPDAYVDDPDAGRLFNGQRVNVGDWCAFRINESWQLNINDVPCRLIEDGNIKVGLDDPGMVF